MIRRNVPSESAAERYVRLLLALYECLRSGRGDGDDAEVIRDEMDLPWRDLGARERHLVEGLAADLNDLDKSPASSPVEPDRSALLQIRDAGQAGEWELVLDLVRHYADLSPPAEVARLRGVCWASLDFPSVAILFFRQIASYAALRPEDEIFLLRCLIQVDRADEALRRAQEICAAGTTPSLLLTAAAVMSVRASQVGQPEQDALCQSAIRAAERGLELAADNPPDEAVEALRPYAYLCLAVNYEHLGRLDRARQACKSVLFLAPDNEYAQRLFGLLSYYDECPADQRSVSLKAFRRQLTMGMLTTPLSV
jgi:tetratricopeptide (TPR) repeat protein